VADSSRALGESALMPAVERPGLRESAPPRSRAGADSLAKMPTMEQGSVLKVPTMEQGSVLKVPAMEQRPGLWRTPAERWAGRP
jgi:hypothetical protein